MHPPVDVYRRIPASALMDLRERVLIAHTGRNTPVFEGDYDPETIHYGGFESNVLVTCASLMPSEWEGERAWQLRGMATDPVHQGQGWGGGLLNFIERDVLAHTSVHLLWCNARDTAVGFYEKHGWVIASEPFMIPGVCVHRRMFKRLAAWRHLVSG